MIGIDETIKLYDQKLNDLLIDADKLKKDFEDLSLPNNTIVTARVKSRASLEEKIHRNGLLNKYTNANQLVDDLKDIIGIRLITLLHGYEKDLWQEIRSKCTLTKLRGEDYLQIAEKEIFLRNMDLPVTQKNKHDIYKIDGFFKNQSANEVKFELQIKSLVHLLWGEVEHMMFYKNYNYKMYSKFNEGIMDHTYSQLMTVDEQLKFIKDQITDQSINSKKYELIRMIGKLLHEKLVPIYKDKYRIDHDFRSIVDNVAFLLLYSSMQNSIEDMIDELPKIVSRMKRINANDIFVIKEYHLTDSPSCKEDKIYNTVLHRYKSDHNISQTVNILNCLNESPDIHEISRILASIYTYEDSIDISHEQIREYTYLALINSELEIFRNVSFSEIISKKKEVIKLFDKVIMNIQESLDKNDDKVYFGKTELENYMKYVEMFLKIHISIIFELPVLGGDIKVLLDCVENTIWADSSNIDIKKLAAFKEKGVIHYKEVAAVWRSYNEK